MQFIRAEIVSTFIIIGCMTINPGLLPLIIGIILLARMIVYQIEKNSQ